MAPEDRPLPVALLVSLLMPDVPHPIVGLFGEQGVGKTTAARVLSLLIDPSPVPVRKAPRDADAWITAASGSWVVAIDNLSTISDWLSDTLCRAVTGDGDVRRQLYTDGSLAVFAFKRAVIVTGIDFGAVRGDLADRLLPIDLHLITEERRLEERSFWPRWAELHPLLLGALLDLVAGVMAALPSVCLESHPRMADFARVLAAVDQILGTDGLTRYSDRAGILALDTLTGDPFITAMADQLSDTFEGTSAQLHAQVSPPDGKPPKGWPTDARQLTTLLKRQAPIMRRAGWTADDLGVGGNAKAVRWRVARPEIARIEHPQHPQHPQIDSDAGPNAGNAGEAGDEYGPSKADPDSSQFPP